MSSPKGVQKQSHSCSCQGCKATNHTLRNLPEVASGTYTSTHRNPPDPEPASGTYTSTRPGTFRNLPEPVSASTHRNPPEPSGTCLRNLHQHTPEPACGTYTSTHRNLLAELTPAHTRTLRSLPEPASGTYTSTHRNPPEPSGTFRNLTLRNLFSPEPAPGTRTGAHRSLSGLKTPWAYTIGEYHVWLRGRILVPQWFCPCGQCHHQKVFENNHMAAPVKVARQQTIPEPSETLELSEPSGNCLRNLHQHTPEPSGTFWKLPPEPTPAHSRTRRNLPPEPTPTSKHRNSPEPAGTLLWNLLLRPAPALTGAFLGWRPH